jgi:multiple sugar transport system permease protein
MTKAGWSAKRKRKDNLVGWLFVSPLVTGVTLFLAFPLLFAIIISFTDYSMMSPYSFFDFKFSFIGFANYTKAFHNSDFMRSLLNACINALGVPIGITLSIVLSNLLLRHPKGSMFLRTLYFLPTICGAIVITFIWQWIFTLIPNLFYIKYGTSPFNMLTGNNFMISMVIMGVWSGFGTSVLLIYASMKGIDPSLYEAAMIDGANAGQQLIHVTLPSISPILFYIFLTGLAGTFQDFARFQVMGSNKPSWYSIMPVWEIYKQSYSGGNIAYASALGIVLGIIIMGFSAVQFLLSKFWVDYQ